MRGKLATLAMLLAVSTACAAPKRAITLICNGTMQTRDATDANSPQDIDKPVKGIGIVVDLTARQVMGVEIAGKITGVNAASISFKDSPESGGRLFTSGDIDRVGGNVTVHIQAKDAQDKIIDQWSYKLLCKPAKRMF
jgi:hypothetical protein